MKKSYIFLIATVVFLFCITAVTAQYSRSIHHNLSIQSGFEFAVVPLNSDTSEVLTVQMLNSNALRVIQTKMDDLGNLVSEENIDFSLNFPISSKIAIAGVHEFGSTRTLALIDINTNSTQRLFWISYNLNGGALTQVYQSPTIFKIGFVRNVFTANQLVAYHVKDAGGLYRIAIDPQNISNGVSEELVNSTITSSTGLSTFVLSKKSGTVVLNGLEEILFYSGGHTDLTFYKRISPNNYTSVATTEPVNGISNTMLLTSNNQLLVITNTKRQLYSTDFNLLNSTTNPGSLMSSELIEKNGMFHLIYNKNGSVNTNYKSFNANLQLVDSFMLTMKLYFGDLISNGNSILGVGRIDFKGLDYNYSGLSFLTNSSCFVFDLPTFNAIKFEEFNHELNTENLSNSLSLGNQTNARKDNLPSVLYNDSVSVLFYSTDYFVGKTSTNAYKGFNGSSDIFNNIDLPGPYTNSSSYDQLIESQYNRGFYVSKAMIIAHLDSLQNGSTSYKAPRGINNWPAHGDISKGQAQFLAPFVDVNSNNTYEPYLGDYPQIYGEECFFSITHMNPNLPESNGLETHAFVYKVACDSTNDFKDVLFKKTFVYSRLFDFDSLHKLTYIDMDLGNYQDDYIGTHAELGLVYSYNGDLYDESNSGRQGFLSNAAAYGVMQLRGAKLENDTLDNQEGVSQNQCTNGYGFNDGIIDNEYYTLERSAMIYGSLQNSFESANSSSQVFSYCNGILLDGSQVTFGGNYNTSTTIPARYYYPNESDTLFYGTYGVNPGFTSSELAPMGSGSMSNPPGDRRVLSFAGSSRVNLGQVIELDHAFVFVIDTTQEASVVGAITENLFDKCKTIKEAFNSNGTACGDLFSPIDPTLKTPLVEIKTLQFYPNPTSGLLTIAGLGENSKIRVFDMSGKLVLTETGNTSKMNLDLSSLKGTVFIFQVESNDTIYQTRIVKQ